MASSDIESIEQELRTRIMQVTICGEYAEAFDIETERTDEKGYVSRITCSFPGLRMDDIIVQMKDPFTIPQFTDAQDKVLKKTCYEIDNFYKCILPSEDVPLNDLRKKYLSSSIHDRLATKGHTRLHYEALDTLYHSMLERKITFELFLDEIHAALYLANAIIDVKDLKLGDLTKKRVLERCVGLYCLFLKYVASRRGIAAPIGPHLKECMNEVQDEDRAMLVLPNEKLDDAFRKLMGRAEIRWLRDREERWLERG